MTSACRLVKSGLSALTYGDWISLITTAVVGIGLTMTFVPEPTREKLMATSVVFLLLAGIVFVVGLVMPKSDQVDAGKAETPIPVIEEVENPPTNELESQLSSIGTFSGFEVFLAVGPPNAIPETAFELRRDGNPVARGRIIRVHADRSWKFGSKEELVGSEGDESLEEILSSDYYKARFARSSHVVCLGMDSFPAHDPGFQGLSTERARRLASAVKAAIGGNSDIQIWTLVLGRATVESKRDDPLEVRQRSAAIVGIDALQKSVLMHDIIRPIVLSTTLDGVKLAEYDCAGISEPHRVDVVRRDPEQPSPSDECRK